ncbi:MAG: chemotaxis protein [Pseudomonadota bacterium]|nr:chemotaxis protein [Pseudomonadota bacterium]
MTEPGAPRVVLLARLGEARDRLGDALVQAGAEVVLVADPVSCDPAEAIASRPHAVLVALEPAVEDALERHEALLSTPGIIVVFDEAELAAHRSGWDAARWVRHLAAKLHRHDDVLPPGWDAEGDLQPSPGPLPTPGNPAGLDIAPFADEAQQHAGEVPRDDGLEPGVRLDGDIAGELTLMDESAQADTVAADPPPEPDYAIADAPLGADDGGMDIDAIDIDALSIDTLSFEALPGDMAEAPESRDDAAGFGIDGLADPAASPGIDFEGAESADAEAAPSTRGTTLELVDVDALLASVESLESGDFEVAAPPPADTPATDLEALEQRVSGLSLADVDSYGHGPLRGAVLVEGGLGGPDAVRQLLAAIPEGFPRPVLVRLQLDGGRYDRLVKQMGRAAQLPVALAEAGQAAEAGTVYFVPPELSIELSGTRLLFVADDTGSRPLLGALPAGDSALLLLSGSGLDSVDAAMKQVPAGLLVVGQALDGCYDATASTALIARGAITAPPAALADLLTGRWPS